MKKQFCQSCGMPMDKDPKGGGTEKDGSKSKKYCSFCYQKGKFVGGDMALEEYQKFLKKAYLKHGTNEFLTWLWTRKFFLKNLERWKKS